MTKIETFPVLSFGKKYSYDTDQVQITEGIFSKDIDTVNFVDVKDIKTSKNIFGWGTITITDVNGDIKLKYIKNPEEIHSKLNKIFLDHKNQMKKVDIS